MVNYNRERFVESSIASVYSQTTSDWELILVENGSTDGSVELIERRLRGQNQARLIKLTTRLTVAAAANIGIREARGNYIARLDTDDLWLPEHMASHLNWLEKPENRGVGICGAQCELINETGSYLGEKSFPICNDDCRRALWYRNPFCQSAVFVRHQCFARLGYYDESFALAEDLELWLRLSQGFELANLPAKLVRQRIWGGSLCMQQHRSLVEATVRARRLAIERCAQGVGFLPALSLVGTWCMRWCPPNCARWLFYKVLLKWDSKTWKQPIPKI